MEAHNTRVSAITARVQDFYNRKVPFRNYHGSTNSTRESQYCRDNIVDTSGFKHILDVNEKAKTAIVEPNVPMDDLVEATLAKGLVPPVVMEFPGITAGGGFSGTSGESSSFRYGFFDRIVNFIEIVIPNGEVVTASRTDKADLFWGAAASFGTLGVITMLEIQLIDAQRYVELTYHATSSMSQAMQKFEEANIDTTNDYLDGIVLGKDRIVICSGRLTNKAKKGVRVQRFTRASDAWFYLHAKDVTEKTSKTVELVPLVDYLFRYDRGGFWVGRYAFTYFITPFNRVTRFLLDRFMRTRVMYRALHQSGHSKQYIIQDVAVPYKAAKEFSEWLHDSYGIYPLWLCPLKQRGKSSDSPRGLLAEKTSEEGPEYLMNFGVWGPGPKDRQKFVTANKRLEQKVQQLQGKKWLYAHAYYTEEDFWTIYDRKEYDALRNKYHAYYLPSIYDKVKVNIAAEGSAVRESWLLWLFLLFWSIWPLSGLYGVYKALRGGDYLLRQKKVQGIESAKDD